MGLGVASVYSISTIVETNEWVDHTREALEDAAPITGSAVDMENGMRGYLLAGQEGFLDPYRAGGNATYTGVAALQETVNDNPAQVERLAEMERVLREWQEKVTEPTIALRREIGDAETMNDMAALVGEARGKVFFDKFREQIATFAGRETTLLEQRRKDFQVAQTKVGEDFKLLHETVGWVDHTHEVLAAAARLVAAAVDMETGMRGYLLAGEDGFLTPYEAGKTAFFEGMQALQKTVDDNPAQVKRLQQAEQTIREWMEQVTEPTIALRREIGDAETMNDIAALVGEARGKVYFDRFRGQIAAFIGREAALLRERRGEFQIAEDAVGGNFGLVQETTGWVNHTHEVLAAAAQLLADAFNMETGMRGYMLSGDESFLDPYIAGKATFFEDMQALQKTVDDNPAQVERLQEMEATITEWVEKVTEPAIALRRQVSAGARPLQDIEALISRKEGKKYFDAFRAEIDAFSQVERNLMAERQETAVGAGTKVSTDLQVMKENEEWVTHTYEVIEHANTILEAAVDMETGMRGFLLAGQDEFLAPYTDGAKRFHEFVREPERDRERQPGPGAVAGRGRADHPRMAGERHRADHRPAPQDRQRQDHGRHGRPDRRGPGQAVLRRLPGDHGRVRGRGRGAHGRTSGDCQRCAREGHGQSRGHEPERGVGHPHLRGDRAGQRHHRLRGRHGDRHARLSARRPGEIPGSLHERSQSVQ